jgi:hypothetical protein
MKGVLRGKSQCSEKEDEKWQFLSTSANNNRVETENKCFRYIKLARV